MNEKVQKHLMRTYAIIFLLFGVFLLVVPNLTMDILSMPHIDGYFWQILAFTYLLFIAAVSWEARKDEKLMDLVIFIKFASAGTFFLSGLILFMFGFIISGIMDSILGTILILFKKFG